MDKLSKFAFCLAAIIGLSAAKKSQAPIDPGPQPNSLQDYHQQGEAAILRGFFDPTSAQFQWDQGIVGGWFKPVLGAKIPGWWTCGLVNGKNRMGGYVGFRRFVVVMNAGKIVYAQTGDGSEYDFLSMQCNQAIQKGILPAPTAQAVAVSDPSTPRLGLNFTAVSEGAYISSVSEGYPAAQAGLLAGMVVTKLNGVALRGFDQATITKLLTAAEGEITLDVIGRGEVKLRRAALIGTPNVATPG